MRRTAQTLSLPVVNGQIAADDEAYRRDNTARRQAEAQNVRTSRLEIFSRTDAVLAHLSARCCSWRLATTTSSEPWPRRGRATRTRIRTATCVHRCSSSHRLSFFSTVRTRSAALAHTPLASGPLRGSPRRRRARAQVGFPLHAERGRSPP